MDVLRKLEPKARSVLAPGERLLAATRAATAARSTFPTSDYMTIGLTNRRIMLWRRGMLTSRVSRMITEIPLTRVAGITIQMGKRARGRMALAFVDAPPLTVDVSVKDNPARLGETFAALRASPAEEANLSVPVSVGGSFVTAPPPPEPPHPPAVSVPAPSRIPVPSPIPIPVPAPTFTPAPAPANERRPCPSCGYRNYATATSCWQCFAPLPLADLTQPLAAPAPSAARPPRLPSSTQAAFLESEGGWCPPSPVKIGRQWSAGRVMAVAAAVVAALVIAAGVYLATRGRAHIAMPTSIIGIQKIDTPEAQQVVADLRDQATKRGWKSEAALYGYSQTDPNMVVMTISAHLSEGSDTLMKDFSASASRAGSGRLRVNLHRTSRTSRGGATVICAPFYGGTKGAVCMWEDRSVLGFVAERGLSVDPTALTAVVRSAVES